MVKEQFKTGNYNAWYTFITKILPTTDIILREKVLRQLDASLESMLGRNSNIIRDNIEVEPVPGSELGLIAVKYRVTYLAEDMRVPDAPKKAIEADTEALQTAMSSITEITQDKLSIDVKTGKVELDFTIDLRG